MTVRGPLVLNDRYEVDPRPIGRGGMGEVLIGRDAKLGREVAVKLIRFPNGVHDDDLVRRFVREARITAGLVHPGVPPVYDVGTYEDRPFMVMQRIRGISVSHVLADRGALPIGWAAAIAAQTCSVLAAAHRASLVHRDLKPGNLMLCPDGTVRVLDFGLAVALAAVDSQITRTGQTLGTPSYMAPELVMAGMTSQQTDLYAVGCTLYEMLAGHTPFQGPTAYAVMRKQVDERPPLIWSRRPEVPAELERLVFRMMAKKPEDRPKDAETVFAALLPFVEEIDTLPGVMAPVGEMNPVRMYAEVVGRVRETTQEPMGPPQDFCRLDLARAREEARALVRRFQYTKAAELLAAVAEPALQVLGPTDPDVLSLRFEIATVHFDRGDYRQAAGGYEQLLDDITGEQQDEKNANPELAWRCRVQEAICQVRLGDIEAAIRRLYQLLDETRQAYGPDDDRVYELRKQIAMLTQIRGDFADAWSQMCALMADMERLYGKDSPQVAEILALLRETIAQTRPEPRQADAMALTLPVDLSAPTAG